MKAIICEMCGSNDIIKEEGLYICQRCGTKYSTEEAKKLLVEAEVRIDDSARVQNYIGLRDRALSAGNFREAEEYCNRILESLSDDYVTWCIKGKASGRQSTLAAPRLKEAASCYAKAVELAPDTEKEAVKADGISEMRDLYRAFASLYGSHYVEFPSASTAEGYRNSVLEILRAEVICNAAGMTPLDERTRSAVASIYGNNAIDAYNKTIKPKYESDAHPSTHAMTQYFEDGYSCALTINCFNSIAPSATMDNIARYESSIWILLQLENAHSARYANGRWHIDRTLGASQKETLVKKRQEYLAMIKELDPNHEPLKEYIDTLKSERSGGCYVATAVYGSYDCPQVWTLRRFRDYKLSRTVMGRIFIKVYYSVSPTFVRMLGHAEWFNEAGRKLLDEFVSKLNAEGYSADPYID